MIAIYTVEIFINNKSEYHTFKDAINCDKFYYNNRSICSIPSTSYISRELYKMLNDKNIFDD